MGLIPFSERSPEERRELGRKGGIASGEARQQRRALRDELDALLSSGDTQSRLCTALIDRAMSGDANAFRILRDTLGETPAAKIETTLTGSRLELDELPEQEQELAKEICRLDLETGSRLFDRMFSLESKRAMVADLLGEGEGAQAPL